MSHLTLNVARRPGAQGSYLQTANAHPVAPACSVAPHDDPRTKSGLVGTLCNWVRNRQLGMRVSKSAPQCVVLMRSQTLSPGSLVIVSLARASAPHLVAKKAVHNGAAARRFQRRCIGRASNRKALGCTGANRVKRPHVIYVVQSAQAPTNLLC